MSLRRRIKIGEARVKRMMVLLCLACLGRADLAYAAEQISIAAPITNPAFAYLFVAIDKGYFAEQGLDPNIQALDGQIATSALIGGGLDYSSSPASAIGAILKGARLKVIYYAARRASEELWSIDDSVRSFSDLRDKLIVVGGRGGSEEIFIRLLLKSERLPSDFVSYSALGVGPIKAAALASGSQQNAMLNMLERGQLQAMGILAKGHIVVDFRKVADMPNGGLATSDQEIAQHRERTIRVMRALLKGAAFMRRYQDATVDILAKRYSNLARGDLADSLADAVENATEDGTVSNETAERELAVRGELMGVASASVPSADQAFDFSLLRGAAEELKAAGWQPSK
jgi:ABC-type nitrate/sulfonate/bicarbonate transport system substrate-binding protein